MLCLRLLLQARNELIAVHAWHHQIDEDEIRGLRDRVGQSGFAASRALRHEARPFEDDLQQFAIVELVVHNQDARGRRGLADEGGHVRASCAATVASTS